MTRRDVRRLAAIDMHGIAGSPRRAKIIRAEFYVGAIGCGLLGAVSLIVGEGWAIIIGLWLIGVAVNYVPLAWAATALSRPGALEAELAGTDLHKEARSAGIRQLWIAVPISIAIMWMVVDRS